jgi:hypothetical protein
LENCCIAIDFNVVRTAETEAEFPRVTILFDYFPKQWLYEELTFEKVSV